MKQGTRRFYDRVAVRTLPSAQGFTVALDGKNILTPAKRVLALRTEALAHGIAMEWERQPKMLQPATMPLMKLATTSIDQAPNIRPAMVDSMIRCLESDVACFRSSEEPALMAREEKTFAPLLRYVADTFDLYLSVSESFTLTHSPEALPRAREVLAEVDDWELTALDAICSASKSFVLSLALANGHIDAEATTAAARVAEKYQTEEWGEIEAGHDLDAANLAIDIGSSAAFLRMLRAEEPIAAPAP